MLRETLLKQDQRILDQRLTLIEMHNCVFVLGDQCADIANRYGQDTIAQACLQTGFATARLTGGTRQRFVQPLRAYRLDQVIDGRHLEGLDGIALESRNEDDCRRVVQATQPSRDANTIDRRHLDVEQHYVRLDPPAKINGVGRIAALSTQFRLRVGLDQPRQPSQSGQFVVNDHYTQPAAHAQRSSSQ